MRLWRIREIAYRAPQAILCLGTALARHGLIDAIPTQIDIAIPRGSRAPKLSAPVNVHGFAKDKSYIGVSPLKRLRQLLRHCDVANGLHALRERVALRS